MRSTYAALSRRVALYFYRAPASARASLSPDAGHRGRRSQSQWPARTPTPQFLHQRAGDLVSGHTVSAGVRTSLARRLATERVFKPLRPCDPDRAEKQQDGDSNPAGNCRYSPRWRSRKASCAHVVVSTHTRISVFQRTQSLVFLRLTPTIPRVKPRSVWQK